MKARAIKGFICLLLITILILASAFWLNAQWKEAHETWENMYVRCQDMIERIYLEITTRRVVRLKDSEKESANQNVDGAMEILRDAQNLEEMAAGKFVAENLTDTIVETIAATKQYNKGITMYRNYNRMYNGDDPVGEFGTFWVPEENFFNVVDKTSVSEFMEKSKKDLVNSKMFHWGYRDFVHYIPKERDKIETMTVGDRLFFKTKEAIKEYVCVDSLEGTIDRTMFEIKDKDGVPVCRDMQKGNILVFITSGDAMKAITLKEAEE